VVSAQALSLPSRRVQGRASFPSSGGGDRKRRAEAKVEACEKTDQDLSILLLEAMEPPRGILGGILAGAARREGRVG
jgi:hypothetical protein